MNIAYTQRWPGKIVCSLITSFIYFICSLPTYIRFVLHLLFLWIQLGEFPLLAVSQVSQAAFSSLLFVVCFCTWPFCHFRIYFHSDYALHYLHATLTFAITNSSRSSNRRPDSLSQSFQICPVYMYVYVFYICIFNPWSRINMPATRWISYTTWIFNQSNEWCRDGSC